MTRLHLNRVIDHVASLADEILADAKTRAEARLQLADWIERNQHLVPLAARPSLVDEVMSIPEDEEFFVSRHSAGFDAASRYGMKED